MTNFIFRGEKKYQNPSTITYTGTTDKEGKPNMKVIVHYLGLVKTYTNKGQDEIVLNKDAALSDLLEKLANSFGKPFSLEVYEPTKKEVKAMFTVMVNGIIMGQLNGVETKLKDGDNIIVMPLMTGG